MTRRLLQCQVLAIVCSWTGCHKKIQLLLLRQTSEHFRFYVVLSRFVTWSTLAGCFLLFPVAVCLHLPLRLNFSCICTISSSPMSKFFFSITFYVIGFGNLTFYSDWLLFVTSSQKVFFKSSVFYYDAPSQTFLNFGMAQDSDRDAELYFLANPS